MFDKKDEEFMGNPNEIVPDGVIDGTEYAKMFADVLLSMENLGDRNQLSKVSFIMNCINICYDKKEEKFDSNKKTVLFDGFNPSRATDVITCLCYFFMTMVDGLEEDSFAMFLTEQIDDVLPDLQRNCQSIPYYDIEGINNIENNIFSGDLEEITEYLSEQQKDKDDNQNDF